jgi:heterodisulfide reductase subunit A
MAVLAVGIEPAEGTNDLAKKLNISQDPYGFLLERHLKVKPSETSVNGIYLAGVIQGPKDIPSSIAQAESAAAKAMAVLSKKEVELDPHIVYYDADKCDHCRLCESICIYNAIKFKGRKLELTPANCSGCGACAAMCPNDALFIPGFTKEQLEAQLETILKKKKESPLMVAFLCNWCSYLGADLAGTSKLTYPTNIRPIRVMCTAMLDPAEVLQAFFHGADGVLIAGCHPQDCHYDEGFNKAATRYESIREILSETNINPKRVKIVSVSAGEGEKFAKVVSEFKAELEDLGPIKPDEFKGKKLPEEETQQEPQPKARVDEI